jgi:hypothetical protein
VRKRGNDERGREEEREWRAEGVTKRRIGEQREW